MSEEELKEFHQKVNIALGQWPLRCDLEDENLPEAYKNLGLEDLMSDLNNSLCAIFVRLKIVGESNE